MKLLKAGKMKSWKVQREYYPEFGDPGITHMKADPSTGIIVPAHYSIVDPWWIDCLCLYDQDDGKLRGVLHHFPIPFGYEKAGDVVEWVDPTMQKRGYGTKLGAKAFEMFNIDWTQQRYTKAGLRLLERYKDAVGA